MLPNRFNKLGVGESTSAVIPLTLTATQVNSTVKLTATGSPNVSGLQFRTNTDKQWTNYTIDAVITLSNVGDFVQFQNTQNTLSTSVSNYVKFVMTGKINGSGSVQSMLNYSAACNDYCYYYLFYGCTSLLTAPDLPSTVLASNCYRGMFNWCTSLVTAPELPASVLATSCYQYLFRNCTSLTTAPELSATNLAQSCYASMFQGCTALTTAPELSATTLANYCYYQMFQNCTSLVTAPELPATTLTSSCYREMFQGCTSLVTAPDLPASTLVNNCYSNMFNGCTSLNSIKVDLTTWNANYTSNWLANVASSGTFYKPSALSIQTGDSYIPSGWTIVNHDVTPLTLTASEANSTVKLNATGSPNVSGLQYRTNTDKQWTNYTISTVINLSNIGDFVQFQNTESTLSTSSDDYVRFVMTGKINGSGNIQSMLNYSVACNDYCYHYLFYGCTALLTAPELPANTLAQYCYRRMFQGCTSLTTAPELPATTLANYCYQYLFRNCASLVTAPELPATTLANNCYAYMFQGCTALTTAPELPATTLANYCYRSMFQDCTSLTTAPELPATTLAQSCYIAMFNGCTSLVTAPDLPATTLVINCYYEMFNGCTSLVTAPELPATTLVINCYGDMFGGCTLLNSVKANFTSWLNNTTTNWLANVSATGAFICPDTLDVTTRSTSRVPEKWTIQTFTPSN